MIIYEPKNLIGQFVLDQICHERQGGAYEWGEFRAIGLLRGERLTAGVVYTGFESDNVSMHVGAIAGKRSFTRGFLVAAFDFPFNHLNRRRATGMVNSKNTAACRFNERLGFRLEGRLRNFFGMDDMLIYGMLKEECRWLSLGARARAHEGTVRCIR